MLIKNFQSCYIVADVALFNLLFQFFQFFVFHIQRKFFNKHKSKHISIYETWMYMELGIESGLSYNWTSHNSCLTWHMGDVKESDFENMIFKVIMQNCIVGTRCEIALRLMSPKTLMMSQHWFR